MMKTLTIRQQSILKRFVWDIKTNKRRFAICSIDGIFIAYGDKVFFKKFLINNSISKVQEICINTRLMHGVEFDDYPRDHVLVVNKTMYIEHHTNLYIYIKHKMEKVDQSEI